MDPASGPRKKLKSPGGDAFANLNIKTSVTCMNVPEILFDGDNAKKHFVKFGRALKIRLLPKKQMCIVEYDHPLAAEKAVLNAGAYDGFMFDVTRTKPRVRKRSKKDDDPDWVPDSDVEDELSAMRGVPTYRMSRQKPMDTTDTDVSKLKTLSKLARHSQLRKTKTSIPAREKKTNIAQPKSGIESPVLVAVPQTNLSTSEAATQLHELRARVSTTPDEQWRILDARDRILRGWGGAGSRVKVGGATIGTCSDMCPEKELLHRQAEHQVMTLETIPNSDGLLESWRAVKQYSRSSADQEIPMCYELRPARVLMLTCSYLLHEIADTTRQVSLADWFHFMWDRLRSIRKDITQQALCCADSILLVEMCARFHAHCAARLADLEHTQFDQKLNTDNLTKCLQTLKHMYADVGPEKKPNEAEFRGYIALLNLGDANFWWEIKQLPIDIQKSSHIVFAIQIFNALDNNNFVRFFRLIQSKATYLQACILLRYFNDVRARALARIVKAYAPRGGSRFPAEDLMNSLAFESVESMKSFINHYGLRFGKDQSELTVILDRNQFIEDSDPYPVSRSVHLIESKRNASVGNVIAGGQLPNNTYVNHTLYTSFNSDGKIKESALIAEDQGYNTVNDSNKNVQALKSEIQRLAQGGRVSLNTNFVKPDARSPNSGTFKLPAVPKYANTNESKLFSFKPAIPIALPEVIKNSPEKIFSADSKSKFLFSKPEDTGGNNLFSVKDIKDKSNIFKSAVSDQNVFDTKSDNKNLFGKIRNENKDPFPNAPFNKDKSEESNLFKKPEVGKSIFGQPVNIDSNKNVLSAATNSNTFPETGNIFAKANENMAKLDSADQFGKGANLFAKPQSVQDGGQPAFGVINKTNIFSESKNLFSKPDLITQSTPKSIFSANGDVSSNKLSPGSLFKSANAENNEYSIFHSKNKAQSVAANIFNSVNVLKANSVYDFNPDEDNNESQRQIDLINEQRIKEELEKERKLQEKIRQEEEKRKEEKRREEEEKRREEERKKQEELKRLEEKRRKEEERKQEELKRRLEEERKAELKRKAEEEARKFRERVERESTELVEEFVDEIRDETVKEIMKDEDEKFRNLMSYATNFTKEVITELSAEMIEAEMKAEKFWTDKLLKKWFYIWREQYNKNFTRRNFLDDTPVWLTEKTPIEEASVLRRMVENAALKNMNAFHKGYRFSGEMKQVPVPEPYNIMEIIKSPLLKRMKQVNYPYDKCFFWKVSLVSPGAGKWVHKKIDLEKWILSVFSDKKKHDVSKTLINVTKQSWNNLIDFAISISLTSNKSDCGEAVEGTNGLLFYATEKDHSIIQKIEETLRQKYPYQVVPVAVILAKMDDESFKFALENLLSTYVDKNIVSNYKILVLNPNNIVESLNTCTKSALKWIAKNYPQNPQIEIDYLKSLCQRYLGNEIWYRLKIERDNQMNTVLKDLENLIKCYNIAVDKITHILTNEDLFNYPSFPLEFKEYLDHTSPYPKPYEFIPSNVKTTENTSGIKDLITKLKLPNPVKGFKAKNAVEMQNGIRSYCKQIGWFENPEEVVCKVVAILPNQFSDLAMPHEEFNHYFEQYDLLDILNIIVYEKINRLNNFDNRYAMYKVSALEDYRNSPWLHEIDFFTKMKHKVIDYEDDVDLFIKAKRRKIAIDSMEYLMLEDNDCTMVEENVSAAEKSILKYDKCEEAVRQLEQQLDDEKKKSIELENLLRAALSDV